MCVRAQAGFLILTMSLLALSGCLGKDSSSLPKPNEPGNELKPGCTYKWETIDDFQFAKEANSTASAITQDSSGNIYVAGYGEDLSGKKHIIVRTSTNSGLTWNTFFTYQKAIGHDSMAYALAFDSSNNLYVVGQGLDPFISKHSVGVIIKSSEKNRHLKISEFHDKISGQDAAATSIIALPSGEVFIAGYIKDFSGYATWGIWKSSKGEKFKQIDRYSLDSLTSAFPFDLAYDPAGKIYAVGYAIDRESVKHWIVRKGWDGGSEWFTNDDYWDQTRTLESEAVSVACNSAGQVFVTGKVSEPKPGQSILRKKSGTIGDWRTANLSKDLKDKTFIESKISIDSTNNIFVLGSTESSTEGSHWIVQKSTDNADNFIQLDDYQYVQGHDSKPTGFLKVSDNDLFVSGTATDASGKMHWIVRKYGCQQITPPHTQSL